IRDDIIRVADKDDKTAIGAEDRREGIAGSGSAEVAFRGNCTKRACRFYGEIREKRQQDSQQEKPAWNFHSAGFEGWVVMVERQSGCCRCPGLRGLRPAVNPNWRIARHSRQ